ncbi:MAG TPA: peroxidase family protein [Abditibacterium sp.]|jgi:prostaglandin-endoperoxide synthase 2
MKTSRRNTANDGLKNQVEHFFLTHFKSAWKAAQKNQVFNKKVNRFLINSVIYKAKTRPYGFSTLAPYTSWDSLTDRTYHGLHLPPVPSDSAQLPPVNEVVKLFERRAGKPTLSSKSTVLFAYFAQWFTDGFLRSDRTNLLKTTSNHDIDLSPLYGLNSRHTRLIRSGQGGKLKSQLINGEEYPPYHFDENGEVKDEFRDLPIVLPAEMNPALKPHLFAMGGDRANVQIGYVMLNTLFLREHNRICEVLKSHNPAWDDERLFQTARNILIVVLINIVVEEYINHISPYHFHFFGDTTAFSDQKWYRQNWICLEFNLLYRWHSLVPDAVALGGEEIGLEKTLWNNDLITSRGLGKCFEDASLQPAGEIGLFNTPRFLLEVERASICQGRLANLASYNDYREICGYPRVTDFDQISARPEVQQGLKRVYGHVDNIEFYVGLFAEDTRPNAAVSSLIGRLVAVDAFSQALTNPLLAENVFNEQTFSPQGLEIIKNTKTLSDILHRNVPRQKRRYHVSMTQKGWRRS